MTTPQPIGPTRQLARFVHRSRWDGLPAVVRREAVRAFVNWVGCAFGGTGHPAVERALRAARTLSPSGACTVLGRPDRLDPLGAALVNGLAVGVNAFDDAHVQTVIHPAAPTVAALLAHAEQHPVAGEDFLHALILSHEIQCRLACALAVAPAHCHIGHYMTGLVGAAGVAAGVGRVMGLTEQRMVWAIGIGAMQGGGLRSSHDSMSSPLIPGDSGRNGLLAARLAAEDFTCQEEPLTTPNGLLPVIGDPPNPAALTDGLGEDWECMNVAIKPFPNGCVLHAATDACLELRRSGTFDPADIDRVELEVSPVTLTLANRREPRDTCEAWVSVYHWAAAALHHGRAGLYEASDACLHDPAVLALSRRVTARADAGLQPDEARGVLTLNGGRQLRVEMRPHVGSAGRPLSDDQVHAKFIGQVEEKLGRSPAEDLARRCWAVGGAADVAAIAPGIWGAPA